MEGGEESRSERRVRRSERVGVRGGLEELKRIGVGRVVYKEIKKRLRVRKEVVDRGMGGREG